MRPDNAKRVTKSVRYHKQRRCFRQTDATYHVYTILKHCPSAPLDCDTAQKFIGRDPSCIHWPSIAEDQAQGTNAFAQRQLGGCPERAG